MEKDELQAALEEAESALEQEENKVVRAGLELQQVVVAFNDNDNVRPLFSFKGEQPTSRPTLNYKNLI